MSCPSDNHCLEPTWSSHKALNTFILFVFIQLLPQFACKPQFLTSLQHFKLLCFLQCVTPSLPGGRAWSTAAKKRKKKEKKMTVFVLDRPNKADVRACARECVCVCARAQEQTCSPYVSVCARVTAQRSPLAGLSVKLGINELGLR